ncbi:MAG: hypothetical protein WCD35_15955 [Mycobacteriales bacterium]
MPRSHLDALGRAGLLGLTGPRAREVVEVLAAACATTWFVMTQHATPLAVLRASANEALRGRRLAAMVDGSVLSGVAIAHLRRPGPPVVTATRVDGGWRFDGHVGWMTGWGLCDVFLLCGTTADRSQVVLALVPARVQEGLRASAPLPLLAMQATGTVTLDLSGFEVADEDVAAVEPFETWAARDRDKAADVSAAVFGVQAECVRLQPDERLADALRAEADRLRAKAYDLFEDSSRYDERLALRADALELCLRSATALVIATGGSAMAMEHPAQRLLRTAAFLQVQAQTAPLRALVLDRLRLRSAEQ